MDKFTVDMRYARINYKYTGERKGPLSDYPHYGLFHRAMNFLSSIGFEVGKDPEIEARYKCISKDYYYGKQRNLEFKARRYPAGFILEFFQNVVHENPHGGCYDFEKYEKMPYLIKKQFELTSRKLSAFLTEMGIEEAPEFIPKSAEERIKRDFYESWHHPQESMDFNLTDLDGQTAAEYNSRSRDGSILHNGEIKYFRDYNGYLCRGRIYHNINNMWWVITDSKTVRNRASHELFDYTPDEPRRFKPAKLPAKIEQKRTVITAMSTKELRRELRRREKAAVHTRLANGCSV